MLKSSVNCARVKCTSRLALLLSEVHFVTWLTSDIHLDRHGSVANDFLINSVEGVRSAFIS